MYQKSAQGHQMAQQILGQAAMILQRFNSLAQQAVGTSFLQQGSRKSQVAAGSAVAVDALSQMKTRYEQLKTTCGNADNQAQIDAEHLQGLNQRLEEVIKQTQTYKSSLRLQSMSEYDSDREDLGALKTQVQEVQAYVNRLRQSCTEILTHYDERKQRRDQNLKALEEARSVINVENADESHAKLDALAQSTDTAAAGLLSMSQGMTQQSALAPPAPQQFVQALPPAPQQQSMMPAGDSQNVASPPLPTSPDSAIIGDLKSLQDMNLAASR